MSVAVVVRDLRQIFARNAKLVGKIVVAGRDNHFAGSIVVRPASAVGGRDAEVSIFPHDRLYPFVLANIEMVMLRNFAVVLQSLFASGLLPRGGERNIADFEQLGGSEKQNAGRIVIE